MEIPKTWLVQGSVAQQPVGAKFSITETLDDIGRVLEHSEYYLEKMRCVRKIHAGSRGGYYRRDPDIYIRNKAPGKVCDGCGFEKSGSSGCVIANKDLRRLLENSQ